MEKLKNAVLEVMEGLKKKKRQQGGDGPERLLKKALTKRQLQHIKFRYFKKGILGINVDSSSWLYALNLEREKALEKLQKEDKGIKEIRFYIGEVR